MADNPFGAALECIPEHQRSIFLTQLRQLLPRHIPTRLGFLAHVDAPEGTGLFWALSLDEHRLVTVIRVAVHGDYALHEHPETDYSCIGLMCESSMRMMDQIRNSDIPPNMGREARSPAAVSLYPLFEHEETTAFRIEAGKYRFNLAPNTIHSSTCLHLLPGYFDALEREYPGAFSGLEQAIAQNRSYPDALELRGLLRAFSPRLTNRPDALLHYRGLADQVVAAFARCTDDQDGARLQERSASEVVERAKELIAESIEQPPTIAQLADALHISRASLCAHFKRQTGMAIGEFSLQLRIQRAQHLLESGDMSLDEVARSVGYRHQSTFCTAFKQATGITPGEWRNRAR